MSEYGIAVTIRASYFDAIDRTRAALAEQGFGVLTEIDVAATMKTKLGVDLRPQIILGACNPPLAYRALSVEPSIGLLLPCNVVVRSLDDEHTIVEAIDPQIMVQVSGDPGLADVAAEARTRLTAALDALQQWEVSV